MLSYTWNLAIEQPVQPNTLSIIQCILATMSIFIDMKYVNHMVQLTIFVPDHIDPSSSEELLECLGGLELPVPIFTTELKTQKRGRPVKPPVNDITLLQVEKMQSNGMKADDIAAFIGVSRRTFYRKFNKAKQESLDPLTPYSNWDLKD